MINANELRIGNIVQDSFKRPGRVIRFTQRMVKLKLEHSTLTVTSLPGVEGLDVDGVELTEEWLVRLGFEKNKDFDWHRDYKWNEYKRHPISIASDDDGNWIIDELDGIQPDGIKFVHYLQNVYFALAGTELPIPAPLSTQPDQRHAKLKTSL